MTTTLRRGVDESAVPAREPRRIAVVPAYNEETTVAAVLERLYPAVDEVLIVNDGSTDRTREKIEEVQATRERIRLVTYEVNRGMSEAYVAAFESLRARFEAGELSGDDLVLTVDADGQHDLAVLDRIVDRLVNENYDAVIAQRDLDNYPRYKVLGNWVMSAWATLFAGMRYHDVESGYRAFRLAALLHALQYYQGYKYSETIEVAVVLPLLGYRVNNDLKVPVPIYRSRTRMKDVVIDLVTAALAWWRTVTQRRRPAISLPRWVLFGAPAVVLAAWSVVLLLMLTKPVFLGTDSMNNYAHVWYLQDRIFNYAEFPKHIHLLDNGEALVFPYGFAPWMVGAMLFPLFGDWIVTALMVTGVVALVVTACLVRPQMRDPWLLGIFVLNPFFVDAVLVMQFSFVWAAVFFFLMVTAAERERWVWAAVLAWLTVTTHPIMGGAAVGIYALFALATWRKKQGHFLASVAVAGALATPFIWLTLQTPSLGDNNVATVVLSVLDILPRRGLVMGAPFLLAALAPQIRQHYVPMVALVVGGLMISVPLANGMFGYAQGSYEGLVRGPEGLYRDFLASPEFDRDAVYRVLEPNQREDGMYDFIRAGAVLSSEFFTESTFRRDFTEPQYQCFLGVKETDFVAIEGAYVEQYDVNELELLQQLESKSLVEVHYADAAGRFTIYDVRTFRDQAPAPVSLLDCGL